MKIVIVGGVAGGASCAARLRRLNEQAEILMVERGPYISYANCGLPFAVEVVCRSGGRAYSAARILVQNGFKARTVSGGMLSRVMHSLAEGSRTVGTLSTAGG